MTAADPVIDFSAVKDFKANLLMQLEDNQSYVLQHMPKLKLHTEVI